MGLFDALGDLAYEVKMDRIISRADREMAKLDQEIAEDRIAEKAVRTVKTVAAAKIAAAKIPGARKHDMRNEYRWWEVDEMLQNTTTNTGKEVSFSWDKEVTEDMQEQVSSFVENMQECVDDFIKKIKGYESDEELYDFHNLDCPESGEYGSGEFDYSTKAKAKIACKNVVESLVKDVKESYEEEKEQIVSYARDYYSGMADMFDEFIGEFLETYDDYISLECEDAAEEYILAQKPVFFNEKALQEEMKPYNLEDKFTALVEERFDVPAKGIFEVKQYFSLCTYDEDEGNYCYLLDDACDKVYQEVDAFLTAEIDAFLGEVFKTYAAAIVSYCAMLKGCLEELQKVH